MNLKNCSNANRIDKIVFPVNNGFIFIDPDNISFFKSDGNYCILNDVNGQSYFISKSLKWVEDQLNIAIFQRVHRYFLINFKNIHKYSIKGDGGFYMVCGTQIPVSRAKKYEIYLFIKNL